MHSRDGILPIIHFFGLITFAPGILCGRPLGVVMWHGIGDTAANERLKILSKIIDEEIPGTYILNIQLGDNSYMDRILSYFMPINEQVLRACKIIRDDENLVSGFHLIGFSQGGLFVRSIVQRCPSSIPGSVISIGGPQQGIFGIPFCPDSTLSAICTYIRNLLSKTAYLDSIQSNLVPAQYWHDPLNEDVYKRKSQFLAEINQETFVNEAYKRNLEKCRNMVLVRFLADTTLVPDESAWFGFYRNGSTSQMFNVTQSAQFTENTLGLRTLYDRGKLHLLSLPGDHLQFSNAWFRESIVQRFLKECHPSFVPIY